MDSIGWIFPKDGTPDIKIMKNRRLFLQQTLATAAALATGSTTLQAANWGENQKLPDLASFGLTGTLPKLAGKVIYLDFWASWCGPCKASFPVLEKWNKQYGPKGFVGLGVSVDEEAKDMMDFLKKTPVSFPTVHDSAHKLVAAANVETMPSSFLIDKKGTIRLMHRGFRASDEAALSAKIEALLNEK